MPDITYADVLNAIRNGAHDVYAIADALGVHHSSYTLRASLHALTQDGDLVRTAREAGDGLGPRHGQAAYLFNIASKE